MSRRLAHRPRYRNMRQFVQLSHSSRQNFFRTRWSYRRQQLSYEKRSPGSSLALIPLRYRLMQYIVVNPF